MTVSHEGIRTCNPYTNLCCKGMQCFVCIHFMSALLTLVVQVNWTIAEAVKVLEGEGVQVSLLGEVFGNYAIPVTIAVVCSETVATDVEPGMGAIPSTNDIACYCEMFEL